MTSTYCDDASQGMSSAFEAGKNHLFNTCAWVGGIVMAAKELIGIGWEKATTQIGGGAVTDSLYTGMDYVKSAASSLYESFIIQKDDTLERVQSTGSAAQQAFTENVIEPADDIREELVAGAKQKMSELASAGEAAKQDVEEKVVERAEQQKDQVVAGAKQKMSELVDAGEAAKKDVVEKVVEPAEQMAADTKQKPADTMKKAAEGISSKVSTPKSGGKSSDNSPKMVSTARQLSPKDQPKKKARDSTQLFAGVATN